MIDRDLLDVLACPFHRTALTLAGNELVSIINARIEAGQLRNRGGELVRTPVDGALICEAGACVFPVEHDIPSLRLEDPLVLDELPGS